MDTAAVEGVHPWELPDLPEDHVLAVEWKTFKREVQRLLREGHEGRYAVIKGDQIIGVWDGEWDAVEAGRDRFWPAPFMVEKIKYRERPVRIPRYS